MTSRCELCCVTANREQKPPPAQSRSGVEPAVGRGSGGSYPISDKIHADNCLGNLCASSRDFLSRAVEYHSGRGSRGVFVRRSESVDGPVRTAVSLAVWLTCRSRMY